MIKKTLEPPRRQERQAKWLISKAQRREDTKGNLEKFSAISVSLWFKNSWRAWRLGGSIFLFVLASLIVVGMVGGQATPQFTCLSPSGFAVELEPRQWYLDLQCQPVIGETLEIQPGQSAQFTVSLSNYYAATARSSASFDIHLAMDRAWVVVRQADQLQGEVITDTLAALQNVAISTNAQTYVFVIENRGLRSAVFDVSLRPRNL
jgi:hypothetical protein